MKSYFRYAPSGCMGIICSPEAPTIYDRSGKLAFTGAIEDVGVWNLRQASQVCTLRYDNPGYPYAERGDVTTLELGGDQTTVCVGYSTGEVRLFNYVDKSIITTLKGHRAAVTALVLKDVSMLVSGGADCNIVLWDLVARVGIGRLKGHKDQITSLAFLNLNEKSYLISSSKDTLVKVWDTDTLHCLQTIVGHRSEVWSLHVLPHEDSSRTKVLTGAADELLRVYTVHDSEVVNGESQILQYYGGIQRSSTDRVVGISQNHSSTLVAVQSAGKNIDFFRVLDKQHSKKKMKKRTKKQASAQQAEDNEAAVDDNTQAMLLEDEMEFVYTLRSSSKVRSFVFSPLAATGTEDSAILAYSNNVLELYKISSGAENSQSLVANKASIIDLQGHRSDIRALALSPNDSMVATGSSETIKTWSTRNGQCLGSSKLEHYALSLCFAPGGRYLLVGCKEGALVVIDLNSGEVVQTIEDAHEGAVWSIALMPDGKGFSTASADKMVKFWVFEVSAKGLNISYDRQLLTPSDVLAVRYNHSATHTMMFATAHLDQNIRIFFQDSLKLYLTLYGHKLPVLSLDISYDNNILVSGSADKTIKIWGMDFGDCHRSLLAHDDSVTAVKFVNRTHYFFSGSKDGSLKYWDADRFEQILYLPGHKGSVWSLDVCSDGSSVFSGGADRTIRLWSRQEDLVFVEEEKERMLEAQVDKAAADAALDQVEDKGQIQGGGAIPSIDSIRSGEQLMQAIDYIEEEVPGIVAADVHDEETAKELHVTSKNALLLGMTPMRYLVRCLRMVKQPDLEPMLLALPFHYVQRLLFLLLQLARSGLEIEMSCRCAVFLLLCHQHQIAASATLAPILIALRDVVLTTIGSYRFMTGVNLAGLYQMHQTISQDMEDIEANKQILTKDGGNKKNKKKRKAATTDV